MYKILLIILFIILGIILFEFLLKDNYPLVCMFIPVVGHRVYGGSDSKTPALFTFSESYNKLLLPEKCNLVIDGYNIINKLPRGDKNIYEQISHLSRLLLARNPNSNSYQHPIHIVIKNYKLEFTDYKNNFLSISKEFPFYYHIAYQSEKSPSEKSQSEKSSHSMKGRDDLLSILLAGETGYIISDDKFRDYPEFYNIKNFTQYSFHNGRMETRDINTKLYFSSKLQQRQPSRISIKFSEELPIDVYNGDIIVEKNINVMYITS